MLGHVALLASPLSHLSTDLLASLLCRDLLLSINQLLLPNLSVLLILPLQFFEVVLLIRRLNLHDFGRFDPRLLDFLEDSLLFVF